jgi:glycine cleavage system aminomethyltransferase T
MGKCLALGHLPPELTAVGTRLDVRSDDINTTAEVASLSFFDPEKLRPRGK